MNIYSVHDSKAEAYLTPLFAPTDGVALRMFVQAAQEEGHQFNKHAADFTLFKIGSFDQITGMIDGQVPETIGNALALAAITNGKAKK